MPSWRLLVQATLRASESHMKLIFGKGLLFTINWHGIIYIFFLFPYWSVLSVFKHIGAYSCLFLHCNNMQEYLRISKNMQEYARIRSIHSNVHKNTLEYARIRKNTQEYAQYAPICLNTLNTLQCAQVSKKTKEYA